MTELLSGELAALLDKTAVVGLSYFDHDGGQLRQQKLAGTVVRVTPGDGITLRQHNNEEFTLPSSAAPWFLAPPGRYHLDDGSQIDNPHYLVTWDIHRCHDDSKADGEHQWWEWVANTTSPVVSSDDK